MVDLNMVHPDKKNSLAFSILEELLNNHKETIITIGITGAGGAGKTTFAKNIVKIIGQENSVSIDLDDYLISRDKRGKLGITGYNPIANKLELARKHIESLQKNKSINKPVYDHKTGKVLSNEKILPKRIIVVEGVTTLYPEFKGVYNFSFFLDASETTQIQSRIRRDVTRRGYSIKDALTLFESVKPDYIKYIEPTKTFATVVFEVGTDYVMRPKNYTK